MSELISALKSIGENGLYSVLLICGTWIMTTLMKCYLGKSKKED